MPKSILVTGAAGTLGQLVVSHLAQKLESGEISALRLADIVPIPCSLPRDQSGLESVKISVSSYDAALTLTKGMDAVIHLAGIPVEAGWEKLITANLVGPAYLWDACVSNNVDRILFASSNHAVGLYPIETRIDHTAPAQPDSRYGITKAFGEHLAALYAEKTPVRGFCMRIGSCFPAVTTTRHRQTFQSPADFIRLIDVGLTADYRYEIVYGLSDIPDAYWDNSNAQRLGYAPKDKPESFIHGALDTTEYRHQGGSFAILPLDPED